MSQTEVEEANLKSSRANAQMRVDEACRIILDGHKSITQALVRAHRFGLPPEKSAAVWAALHACVNDAEVAFKAAIAQPEPRITTKSRVQL